MRNGEQDILERRLTLEKEVLKIIIGSSNYIDEDGIFLIQYNENRLEYYILNKTLTLRLQKYFEEEYSLYFVSNNLETGSSQYRTITFVWDSFEYNIGHKDYQKARQIIKALNKKESSSQNIAD